MLRMGDQVLGQLAAAAQDHDRLAGQHGGRRQPGREVGHHLGQPVQTGQREIGIGGLGHQTDQELRIIRTRQMPALQDVLGGPGVDEATAGQGPPSRPNPNHTLMLRRRYPRARVIGPIDFGRICAIVHLPRSDAGKAVR